MAKVLSALFYHLLVTWGQFATQKMLKVSPKFFLAVTPSVKGALGHPIHIKCTTIFIIFQNNSTYNKGVCHTVALPFTLKKAYFNNANEELSKLKYFTKQKYNFSKKKIL